jgi:hypothetical protein
MLSDVIRSGSHQICLCFVCKAHVHRKCLGGKKLLSTEYVRMNMLMYSKETDGEQIVNN